MAHRTGDGLSLACFDYEVEVAEVERAIAEKVEEIGWNDVRRPALKSQTIYRVIRRAEQCAEGNTPMPAHRHGVRPERGE